MTFLDFFHIHLEDETQRVGIGPDVTNLPDLSTTTGTGLVICQK